MPKYFGGSAEDPMLKHFGGDPPPLGPEMAESPSRIAPFNGELI